MEVEISYDDSFINLDFPLLQSIDKKVKKLDEDKSQNYE
jgi:hypothetical protein